MVTSIIYQKEIAKIEKILLGITPSEMPAAEANRMSLRAAREAVEKFVSKIEQQERRQRTRA